MPIPTGMDGETMDLLTPMDDNVVERVKRFVFRHFERLLAMLLVVATLVIHLFIEQKLAFLSFYYLPVIAAGFLVGKRMAVWAAVFVVLLVTYVQASTGLTGSPGIGTNELMHLIPWGGFMILTGYCVGLLADQRKARTDDVRATYLTMLELLTLHVDSSDRMRRGHSYRVGERSVQLAQELGLTDTQQEDLRVAGLLHEIGPRDPRLVRVMSDIPAFKDSKISSMRKALRLVDEYSHYHEVVSTGWPVDDTRITIGAKILAVADAYETLQTPTPTRQAFAPWTALEEIERGVGTTFATEVVKALRKTARIEKVEQHSDIRAIRLA
ncbi:MAG TPA: HD domain-containing protein [Gemmatimonadaceae bacterium]|nr:HD domain-containing protein [Gemmatimonadaceae bacterium]